MQRRHNCSPAASFANCVMTLYLLKAHLQAFLSIPITQKCQILSCDTLVANVRTDITKFYRIHGTFIKTWISNFAEWEVPSKIRNTQLLKRAISLCCNNKVKWSRYRPGVAQMLGRCIPLLFHDRGTRRGWMFSSTPRPHFTPGKDPVPMLQEAGWAPGPIWTGGKSRPHRDSISDRPARSSVAIPTELSGPQMWYVLVKI